MGRHFKYTAEQLESLFEDYKIARKKEKDIRYELIKSGEKAGDVIEIEIPKPLTIASFCHFINCTEKSFYSWINGESENLDPELLKFVTRVQEEIRDFQLSGAINNVYNPNIVARLNGLADRQEITETNKPEQVIINIQGSNFDLTK